MKKNIIFLVLGPDINSEVESQKHLLFVLG